jgi:PAS domain S-box-containing protein
MDRPVQGASIQSREALSLPASLFSTLLEIADDAVVVIDERHAIVLFNRGAERIFRYRAEEVLGEPVTLLLPESAAAQHDGYIDAFGRQAVPTRRMGERSEIEGRRAGGELFAAEASISRVDIGGLRYYAAIVRDISERKSADLALAASEARFRTLAESAPVGIFQTDATGACVYVNSRWSEIAGMQPHEALDSGWSRALHPDDRAAVYQAWRAATGARRVFAMEYRFLRPDGRETWVYGHAVPAPMIGHGGEGYIGTTTDITDRRLQSAALEQAKQEAEAAARAKSLFLANMSHEIRTPLNAVIGMTSLLMDTPISEEQKDLTQTIRASGEALLAIINDILDFSKADLGKLDLEHQGFDLRRAIEDSLDLLAPAGAAKGLNLAYFIEDGVPESLVGDVTRLRQILVNLIGNAVKFTHQGEVLVHVDGRTVDTGGYRLHIAVRDTGIGIPRDRLPHLFQSFAQVDPSTTRKYGGTGLGLAISRRLAELMGGTAWAESEPGVGSTFHVTAELEPGPAHDHLYLRRHAPVLSGKRVLIVDDNTTNRRILVKQCLLWGMLPSAHPSAAEALDLVRHGHGFDVAVLDMGMPDMDGIDLAWEIRKYCGAVELPIVLLTSIGTRLGAATDPELGLAAFVYKPIKPAQLFRVLVDALGGVSSGGQAPDAPSDYGPKLAEQLPLRILVAEDNAVNQRVVLRLLERLGYRADIAANGIEVLDALERQPYDLVLMDVQMPEMDGIEAARRVFQRFDRHEAPRLVAMTANAMPGDRELALSVGMEGYLTKPIDVATLRQALLGLGVRPMASSPSTLESLDVGRLDELSAMDEGNSTNMVRDLIDMFLSDAPEQIRNLWNALRRRDAAAFQATVHRFLSSIENIGARRMAALCFDLERAGHGEVVPEVQPLLTQLTQELERVRALLEVERRRF